MRMCDRLVVLARILIGVLSVLFTIAGFGVLLIGLVVKVQVDALEQLWQPLISTATSQARAAASSSVNLNADYVDIEQLVGGLSVVFIVPGVVLFIIGVVGLAGACCMIKIMAICYLVFAGAMTVGMLIVVIILAVNRSIVTDPAKAELKTTLQNEYRGLNGSDVTSFMWNSIMIWQQCCGIDNSNDFDSATTWQGLFGSSSSFGYKTPAVCCKTGLYDPPTTEICATTPTTTNNNMDTGCYNKLLDLVFAGPEFIAFSCGSVGGLGLLTLCSVIILYDIIKKSKQKSVE